MTDPSHSNSTPVSSGYQQSYDAAKAAVENYPAIAISLQLQFMTGKARTEAQWGAVDALTDLLQHREAATPSRERD